MATSVLDYLTYDFSNTMLSDAVKHARQIKSNKAKWSEVALQVKNCVHNNLLWSANNEWCITNEFAIEEGATPGNPAPMLDFDLYIKSMDIWVCEDVWDDNISCWTEFDKEGFDGSEFWSEPGKGWNGRKIKEINKHYDGTYLELEW